MEYYILKKLVNNSKYKYFYIGLTFESIMNFVDDLSKKLIGEEGFILIDQLLITGNNKNRFLEFYFSNGKLDFSSAKNIKVDNYFLKISKELLQLYPTYIENSILSSKQKNDILLGKLI